MLNNILIVEDEKPNATRIKRLMTKLRPQVQILAVEESITNTVQWLSQHNSPDLILMDIRLADGLSFEIFNQIEVKCPVIFTTAYDEYAVKAFKYNGIDYLLKPIEESELDTALKRAESMLEAGNDMKSAIQALLNQVQAKEYRSRFLLPHKDGFKSVLVEDISFFYTEVGINRARLIDGSLEIIPQTLEELEQQLDPKYFFRANRQFILHIDSIKQIHNHFNGKLKIELRKYPDIEVIVSREKASALKIWMDF